MKIFNNLVLLSLCAGMAACTNDTFDEEGFVGVGGNATLKEITVTLPEIEDESGAETRTQFVMDASGVKAYWAEGDTIGIFPANGDQVSFPINGGVETNVATFDGGDWGLKAGRSYAAYFPYNKWNIFRDNETILLDYTGQVQTGNNNADHLGAYDFLAAGQISPNASGYLNLDMQRLGCIVMLELVVPDAGTYTSATLTSSSTEFVTTAELNISSAEPQVNAKASCSTYTLGLKDVTLAVGDTLKAYFMCAPINLTVGKLTISLVSDNYYSTELTPKYLEAGKPYKFTGSLSLVGNIDFADTEVKRICVENWDANGDGELNYAEAAAVTDIGSVFQGRYQEPSPISSFEEFQYFTSVKSIANNAFSYCSNMSSIMLPKSVTSIGYFAFDGCESLASITIPSRVTIIDDHAFYGCSSLTEITLPEGLIEIRNQAFAGCRSLTSVTLPESLRILNGFDQCPNLTNINIPSGVIEIGSAFWYDSSLISIKIPDGVTKIDSRTFERCTSLSDVELPLGLTSIGDNAFKDCPNLTTISIPSGVSSIGESAFQGCKNLTSIKLSAGIKFLGSNAFENCSNLDSIICYALAPLDYDSVDMFENTNDCPIYVPASSVDSYKSKWTDYAERIVALPDIIDFANEQIKELCLYFDNDGDGELSYYEFSRVTDNDFYMWSSNGFRNYIPTVNTRTGQGTTFDEFQFFTNITTISDYAFSNCSGLTSIILPEGVRTIGNQAFEGCYALNYIYLPKSLVSIGDNAFAGCYVKGHAYWSGGDTAFEYGLTSITIPENITSIGNNAFSGCLKLNKVICLASAPPLLGTAAFEDTGDCPIYVPVSSVDLYKVAWLDYADRIHPYYPSYY